MALLCKIKNKININHNEAELKFFIKQKKENMKKLLFLVSTVATLSNVNAQTCAAARSAGVGANVNVRGVCINGAELGSIRYIQDNTGGIAAYGNNLSGLLRGDSVVISGPITEYKNLYEITPATFIYVSSNAHIPNPTVITANQFGEAQEGVLTKVMNCTFGTTGTFGANVNYTVTANGQPLVVRTNTASPIVGMNIPTGAVNIVGVGSQFCSSPTSGCTDGYQLLIRDMSDITAYTASVTGISEVTKSSAVAVYPNPASGTLNFKVANDAQVKSITVSDIFGRTVFTTNENVNKIDVSTFAKGLYNLLISADNTKYQSKFIVE